MLSVHFKNLNTFLKCYGLLKKIGFGRVIRTKKVNNTLLFYDIVKRKDYAFDYHLKEEEVIQHIPNGVKISNQIHLPLSRQILFIIIFH